MSSPRRVALVHRFYAPDSTGYAHMLERFAVHLADLGHQVTVLCGPPSYNGNYAGPPVPRRETVGGVHVRRLRVPGAATAAGKLLGQVIFPLAVAFHLVTRRRPYDVVSVTTVPPVLMGVVGRMSRLRSRRTRVVYHCMDLYPEVAGTIGFDQSGWFARLARRVDTATVGAADQTIVLSHDMLRTLSERGVDTTKVAVCNNFIIESSPDLDASAEQHPPDGDGSGGRHRFIFAGNIGRFQGIEALVEGFELAHRRGSSAELVLMGGGALCQWVEEQADARTLPITVWNHRPLREAMASISAADTGIVSLDAGVIRAAYPSKLMTYLELGRPVLAIVEDQSDLAETVRRHELGDVAAPDDPASIADAMLRLERSPCDHRRVQQVGRTLFSSDVVLPQWSSLYGLEPAS